MLLKGSEACRCARHPLCRSSDAATFGTFDTRKPPAGKLNVLGFYVDVLNPNRTSLAKHVSSRKAWRPWATVWPDGCCEAILPMSEDVPQTLIGQSVAGTNALPWVDRAHAMQGKPAHRVAC